MKDILIIGAGVSGLSVALELLLRGRKVGLWERAQAGGESSWAGGGIICPLLPWDYPAATTALALRAMHGFSAWLDPAERLADIQAEYQVCGMTAFDVDNLPDALDWCHRHGLDAQPCARQPATLRLPSVAQVRNPRLIAVLRAAFLKLGGTLYEHSPATAIVSHPTHVRLQALQTEFEFDQLVVATGAWAGLGLPGLAATPNIRPVRGQMLLYKLAPDTLDTILYRRGLYIIPRLDGHILVGSTLEDAGFDKSTDTATAERLHAEAVQLLPVLAAHKPIRQWAGLRPGSPDNIPVIGRHPDFDNVFVSTGHFRYGVTMAPASAELLADLMEGKTPALDPTPYSWAAAEQRRWTDRF